jgi:crossover junction endodeoxyribonuclease RusA
MPTITLPLPPSTNRLWRAGRGRVYRSKRYLTWCRTAGWELNLQRPARLTGAVVVTISAGRPDRRRRDIDNLAKSTLDLLVAHRVIEDDAKVVSITSRWCDGTTPGRIAVTVAAVN